jgi:HD-GYP domain-containing protein (c-di-GMP phosphodiesterase class II)
MSKFSFSLKDYFPIPARKMVDRKPRSFPLYLYFRQNNHLILCCRENSEFVQGQMETYRRFKLKEFWCPSAFLPNWVDYLQETGHPISEIEKSLEEAKQVVKDEYDRFVKSGSGSKEKGDYGGPSKSSLEFINDEIIRVKEKGKDLLNQGEKAFDGDGTEDEKKTHLSGGAEGDAKSRLKGAESGESGINDLDDEEKAAAAAEQEQERDVDGEAPIEDEEEREVAGSPEAAEAIDLIRDKKTPAEEKAEVLKELSRKALEAKRVGSKEEQERLKNFARDVAKAAAEDGPMEDLLKSLSTTSDGIERHSQRVSNFAILIAMGVGVVEKEDLADVAMGGLLHDVGWSALSGPLQAHIEMAKLPYDKLSEEQKAAYEDHATAGGGLVSKLQLELTAGVEEIILLHSPAKSGRSLSKLAQIVMVSDYLDDLKSGKVDGTKKDQKEALDVLSEILKNPQGQFNLTTELGEKIVAYLNESHSGKAA